MVCIVCVVVVSSRRRHTRCYRDWSSDVCSSDLHHPMMGVTGRGLLPLPDFATQVDRKSTRLNSSHGSISYAVFCLQKTNKYMSSRMGEVPLPSQMLYPLQPYHP